jgi:hypothetical protein
MAKRSDGIFKVDDIDEKEFLSILDGKATPTALPSKDRKEKIESPVSETEEPEKDIQEDISEIEEREEPNEQKSQRPVSKHKQGEIYEGKFLQPRELKIRQCVYISRDVHETIADIVKRIGERGLTVGVYIDTILQLHLQEHKDEINALYCKPTEKIIK